MTNRRMYDLNYQVEEILSRDDVKQENDDLVLPTLNEYEEEEIEWLINGYIPKGQITLLCGTGGTGKTSVWASLAASLSNGERTLFDGNNYVEKRDPLNIVFFSGEDTVENVIKKKLRQEHANMNNIRTLSLTNERFEKVKFGSKYLNDVIRKYQPDLCVFDPLQAFINGNVRMADRNAMRQTMRPLIELGKNGTAFLIVMHSNKLANAWGRNRMADSADLWDIARCVLMVGDADEQGHLKYISHEKSNYGKTGKTLIFNNDPGTPVFQYWSDKKDRDFVQEATKRRNAAKDNGTVQEVCNLILSELSEKPDGMLVEDIDGLMEALGFKAWMIKEAKQNLKQSSLIKYFKTGMASKWMVRRTEKNK